MRRYKLMFRASITVIVVIAIKCFVHFLGWEILSINPLFSGIVAANVFLIGFLLSGVLADYKESERLPGELAASLENLAQEALGVRLVRAEANVLPFLHQTAAIGRDVLAWFYKQQRTRVLLDQINALTPQIASLEQWTQAGLAARLKQEQSSLRRTIIRIHTIRETSFVSSGYLLADMITILLCLGLVLVDIEPFSESLFLVGVISFVMIFLLMLIRDLDNPFGYYEKTSGEDVSLKPMEDMLIRLDTLVDDEHLFAQDKIDECPPPFRQKDTKREGTISCFC